MMEKCTVIRPCSLRISNAPPEPGPCLLYRWEGPLPHEEDDRGDGGMGGWEVAAIVIGVGAILVAAACCWCASRARRGGGRPSDGGDAEEGGRRRPRRSFW